MVPAGCRLLRLRHRAPRRSGSRRSAVDSGEGENLTLPCRRACEEAAGADPPCRSAAGTPRRGVAEVERLIRTAQSLAERSGRVVIHCQAGISRSTAAATIFYAVLLGEGREDEAIARVLAAREVAIPNRRMIRIAEELLGRDGRLIAAVQRAMDG